MASMSRDDLKELVGYEVFFLTETFGIIGQPISGRYEETLDYPEDGSGPGRMTHGYASMMTGDWRSGFLSAGGPLILVSSFKVLDLIVEWLLGSEARTGKGGALQFSQKVALLKESSRIWPDFFHEQSPIRTRFVALYEALYPYRNTIVHAARFTRTNGGVKVAPSEGKGAFGDPVHMDARFLKHIASIAVLLANILQGTWKLDQYSNQKLRWSLNAIRSLHKVPLDEYVKPPSLALVRIHREEAPVIHFDMVGIGSELNQPVMVPVEDYGDVDFRKTHAFFDLEIILKRATGEKRRCLIPFTLIDKFSNGIPLERLAEFEFSRVNVE